MAKKMVVPSKVTKQLQSTLAKARKDRWAYNGDVWDLEKWVKLAKAGKAEELANSIYDADSDTQEYLTQYVYRWADGVIYKLQGCF